MPSRWWLATLPHPDLIQESGRYKADVVTGNGITRGYASMAWETFGLEANATVIEKADRESFFGLLGDVLETQTTPNRPLQKAD